MSFFYRNYCAKFFSYALAFQKISTMNARCMFAFGTIRM